MGLTFHGRRQTVNTGELYGLLEGDSPTVERKSRDWKRVRAAGNSMGLTSVLNRLARMGLVEKAGFLAII